MISIRVIYNVEQLKGEGLVFRATIGITQTEPWSIDARILPFITNDWDISRSAGLLSQITSPHHKCLHTLKCFIKDKYIPRVMEIVKTGRDEYIKTNKIPEDIFNI